MWPAAPSPTESQRALVGPGDDLRPYPIVRRPVHDGNYQRIPADGG